MIGNVVGFLLHLPVVIHASCVTSPANRHPYVLMETPEELVLPEVLCSERLRNT